MNEHEALFSDYKSVLDFWLSAIGVGALAGTCAAILSEDMRTLKGVLRCCILAIFAGYLIGQVSDAYGLNVGLSHALIGLGGFLANYLFIALLKMIKFVSEHPDTVARAVADYFWEKITELFQRRGQK